MGPMGQKKTIDDQNARRAHNPDGNVEPFRSVFAKPLDPVPPLTLEDDLLSGIDDLDPQSPDWKQTK